jgi:hypothetical protein
VFHLVGIDLIHGCFVGAALVHRDLLRNTVGLHGLGKKTQGRFLVTPGCQQKIYRFPLLVQWPSSSCAPGRQVPRACQGVTFHTVDIARQFMAKAKTASGLKVTAEVLDGLYVKGKKVAADFLANMRIVFDEHLPRWNYRAVPANS